MPSFKALSCILTCGFCLIAFTTYAQDSEEASISGQLLMLDNRTPHVAVLVQVVGNGKVAASTLSEEDGAYRFTNLKPGAYQVRCQIDGEYIYYSTPRPEGESAPSALGSRPLGEILQVKRSQPMTNIDFRIAPFKKGTWRTYTYFDGLAHNSVQCIHETANGMLWFATRGGVSCYDGVEFVNFTTNDGLADNSVLSIHETANGMLWFATSGGISRYDGVEFVNFTTNDGLADNTVSSIHETREGMLWFGTLGGVSHYDGKAFVNFTANDGLAHNRVLSIHETRDGMLWFGTRGGVSHYDGEGFTTLTTHEGLGQSGVLDIYESASGDLFLATDGAGVFLYDGITFQSLDTRDFANTQQDIASNIILKIHQDAKGVFWFATSGGLVRYVPSKRKPKVHIVAVKGDKDYTQRDVISLTAGTRLTIVYGAVGDFKTHPQKRVYRYRIQAPDSAWGRFTNTTATSFESRFDEPGKYTFEVEYVDRDFNVSDPARVVLHVVPPWYENGWILYSSGSAIVAVLLFCGVLGYRYYQERQQVLAYQREAVLELADAREMQMGLIPQTAPEVSGLEIAGKCVSSNTVSGDFFDYVTLGNDMLAIVLADVTGKGMKGAMNAVLSSGALHSEAKFGVSPSQMLWVLNRNLHPRFQRHTNCAMAMVTINPENRTLQYANAGIPYPIVKRGETVEELELNGMPLGAFKLAEYEEIPPFELRAGDLMILFIDGITEAPQRDNPEQLYMETDRLTNLIRGFEKKLNAQAMINAIIEDVRDFSGDAQQSDDMTIVVVKAL